jgi:hypothetical protein
MNQKKLDTLKHFTSFCKKELNIQSLPHISLIYSKSFVEQNRSYGEYSPSANTAKVFCKGRNLADICRSLAHELTHHRQQELGMINDESGSTGSNIENDANAMAGIIMRDYGKLNLSIYDLNSENTVSLTERKQVGTLYHFTNYYRMVKIVEGNFILTSNIQPSVSFTRNKQMKSNTVRH